MAESSPEDTGHRILHRESLAEQRLRHIREDIVIDEAKRKHEILYRKIDGQYIENISQHPVMIDLDQLLTDFNEVVPMTLLGSLFSFKNHALSTEMQALLQSAKFNMAYPHISQVDRIAEHITTFSIIQRIHSFVSWEVLGKIIKILRKVFEQRAGTVNYMAIATLLMLDIKGLQQKFQNIENQLLEAELQRRRKIRINVRVQPLLMQSIRDYPTRKSSWNTSPRQTYLQNLVPDLTAPDAKFVAAHEKALSLVAKKAKTLSRRRNRRYSNGGLSPRKEHTYKQSLSIDSSPRSDLLTQVRDNTIHYVSPSAKINRKLAALENKIILKTTEPLPESDYEKTERVEREKNRVKHNSMDSLIEVHSESTLASFPDIVERIKELVPGKYHSALYRANKEKRLRHALCEIHARMFPLCTKVKDTCHSHTDTRSRLARFFKLRRSTKKRYVTSPSPAPARTSMLRASIASPSLRPPPSVLPSA